jgi:hypothetical protein
VSIRRIHILALVWCLLVGCQTRTVLVEAPRAPTPTAQPLIAASPSPISPTDSPAGAPVEPSPSAVVTSPDAAASPTIGIAGAPSAVAASLPACQYSVTRQLADVQDRALSEASALAASQRRPGIYWTLNDSGNSPTVFGIDEDGRSRGTFRVDKAENVDWEAMQVGPGSDGGPALYIGDIGDNDRERREIVIYRVPEPDVEPPGSRATNSRTAQAEAFKLQYPDGPRDAEGLLVHPQTGEMLIVTKELPGRAGVYRVPLPVDVRRTVKVERVAEVDMGRVGVKIDVVTDATVAADGRRVTVRTYGSALEYDVMDGAPLASIWEQMPRVARLDDGPQAEGITYRANGQALVSIGESIPTHLFETPWQC